MYILIYMDFLIIIEKINHITVSNLHLCMVLLVILKRVVIPFIGSFDKLADCHKHHQRTRLLDCDFYLIKSEKIFTLLIN